MTGHKLATPRPARAVGAPTGGVLDGDGGGTAGPSRTGGWAVRANGSQPRETPPRRSSPGVNVEPTTSRRSPPLRRAQTPVSADCSGRSSLETGRASEPSPPADTPPPFLLHLCRFTESTGAVPSKTYRQRVNSSS